MLKYDYILLICRNSNIKQSDGKDKVHHELLGNFFENQLNQAQKLINTLSRDGNPFEYPDLRNLMNYSVPRNQICKDVIERDQLGLKYVENFRKERMMPNSKTPFWDPLPKNNLEMFSDTEIRAGNTQKLVTSVRKEKQLYARMLAISRTRPELCPNKVIGEYEFTNFPPSNFLSDGTMITAKYKTNVTLIGLLKKLPIRSHSNMQELKTEKSITIIDAMDILNLVKKRKPMQSVQDLVNLFLKELTRSSNNYSEVRLLFHPFVSNSFKQSVSQKIIPSKKVAIHYHIKNNTPIKNIDQFLAHINTRIELATFLAQRMLDEFQNSSIIFLTTYGNKIVANRPLFEICSKELAEGLHSLEETNQLILVNAIDIAQKNPNRKLLIQATSVDMVVKLLDSYMFIPPSTTITFAGEHLSIGDLHSRLGEKISKALFGWYAFQGKIVK